ncbi:MAG TPA: ABC transporter permease [Terracidiphilus sp.]|jgi:predicted permease|nr:ABC transporter permease [Terracidiphilus sp.]
MAPFFHKLSILFRRERFRNELEEEMAFHRARVEEELRSEGMAPEAAHTAAARQLGNATLLREKSHGVVGFGFESILADLRYAMRQLWNSPSFTIVMLLTLALSIGANSAIFSVIDGVLLKTLPYPRADRLVRVFLSNSSYPKFPLNPFDLRDYRARNQSFESIAGFTRGDVQLSGSGEPVRLNGFGITAGYFHVLGLRPQLGREFDQKAEIPGNGLQVILSDRLWRSRFNADPAIIGRKITLNTQPFTVIGVMAAGTEHPGNEYHAVAYGESVDVWWPFSFAGDPNRRGSHFVEGIARLKDGVSVEQARAEMNGVMTQLGREHPNNDAGWTVLVIPLYDEIVGKSRQLLLVLLGAVGMVLLIACANAANLLLVRASARQRELAVRLAMGAPRIRVLRQLLTESLLISLAGGALGLVLAFSGVDALVSLLPADFPRANDIHVSAPVLAFTFLVSLITGLLFGMAPALQASRTDPKQGLQKGGRTTTATGYQSRLRSALVIAEVSLACVLLIGAGLMLRSLLNQMHIDPGFQQKHVLTASLSLPHEQYKTNAATGRFYDQLVGDLSALPGVESAGAGSDLPWTGWDENAGGFSIEGKKPQPGQEYHARYHMATPGYFSALGVPLISGRFFKASDTETAPPVILINHAMAARYWPGENVVGKRMTFEDQPKEKDWMTVVGVVGDIKDQPNSPQAEPGFWWPELYAANPDMSIVMRSSSNPELLADALRNEVHRLNPALAVADVQVLDRIVNTSVSTPRFAFVLVGIFAALAIVLAAIGIYGVIAYSVSQRTAEFGLRMALGAQQGDVLSLVLVHAAKLTLLGAALGIVASLACARVLRTLIFHVAPADPATFSAVGALVVGVALAACYLPARRATQADPMSALRAE